MTVWAKGFNTIIVNLIEHYYADNAPANYYGVYPFTNKLSGGYWDFSSINPDYFTNSDAAISRAGYYGIQVILAPAYLGYDGGSQGWYQDMINNSLVNLTNWGTFVGNRYKGYTNIIWLSGCDYEAPNKTVVDAVATGILQSDPNHLMTAHCVRGDSAFDYYTESWDKFDSTYTANITYIKTLSDYQRSPVSPTFLIEAYYEVPGNSSYPAIQTRQEAYGAVLSGAMGGCFGVDKIDVFSSGWQANLQSPGSLAYTNLIKLVRTRPWYNCVPDSGHTVVTSGYGTSGQTDYITAMRESTGKTIIAYVPQDQMTFTVAMNQISGSTVNAWWYNPRDGTATLFAAYATSGSQSFTPPDASDWVLVLDDASQNYVPPGGAVAAELAVTSTSLPNAVAGAAYSFQLQAGGGTPPYGWTLAAGALPSGLALAPDGLVNGTPGTAGTFDFTVQVTDANSASAAQALVLTVGAGPTITAQPQSAAVAAGQAAQFTVVASGTAPLSYQWQFGGTAIAGATAGSYSIASVQAANAGSYSVVVANNYGSVTSSAAVLTVGAGPTITAQPQSAAVAAGQAAQFTVGASGTAPLSYQWQFGGVAIAGATASGYSIASAQAANAGSYSVVVTNNYGSVTSSAAVLTVQPGGGGATDLLSQMNPNFVWLSQTLASGNVTTWIDLSNSLAFTTSKQRRGNYPTNNTAANAGVYFNGNGSCFMTNTGIALSGSGNWTIASTIMTPGLSFYYGSLGSDVNGHNGAFWSCHPVCLDLCWGNSDHESPASSLAAGVRYNIMVSSSAGARTVWTNGVQLMTANGFPTWVLSNIGDDSGDAYKGYIQRFVVWTNAAKTLTDAVNWNTYCSTSNAGPTITAQPQSVAVAAGQAAQFTVGASGTAPLSYQWQFGGTAIAGATASGYSIASVQAANAGSYSVVVTNNYGSVTSSAAVLTVGAGPTITAQPQSAAVAAGQAAQFTVGASGTAPLSYQWQFGGTAIAGATASSYSIASAQAANAGSYSVVVTNNYGSVTSSAAVLTMGAGPRSQRSRRAWRWRQGRRRNSRWWRAGRRR